MKMRVVLTSFLITAVLSSTAFPLSVQALGGSAGGGFNITGVGAIALSCTNITPGSITDGIGNLFDGAVEEAVDETTEQVSDLVTDSVVEEGGGFITGLLASLGGSEVPTIDKVTREALIGEDDDDMDLSSVESLLEELGEYGAEVVDDATSGGDQKNILENTKNTADRTTDTVTKEECGDKLAKFIVNEVIDRITLETVKWINSGFEGSPFYLENPKQFFTDLAAKDLFGFSSTFAADFGNYPFGQQVSRAFYDVFSTTFEQNMQNSLNNVLAHGTREEFSVDFSVGGWVGYTALLEDNNNALGSYLASSNHIAQELKGTHSSDSETFRRELGESGGFLSQRECAQTQGGGVYIEANLPLHLPSSSPFTDISQLSGTTALNYITSTDTFETDGDLNTTDDQLTGMGISPTDTETILEVANSARVNSLCERWRTVTPGYQIADSLTSAIGSSQEQLIAADEINENLGLILDALLNQLFQQGLAYLWKDGQDYSGDPSSPNFNALWAQSNGYDASTYSGDSSPVDEAINGSADDESQTGILGIQQDYLTALEAIIPEIELLIRRTYDLDYCVPGPNPNWQGNLAGNLTDFLVEGGVAPTGSSTYYQSVFDSITGTSSNDILFPANITNGTAFIGIVDTVYLSYSSWINSLYTDSDFPSVRNAAANHYGNIGGLAFNLIDYNSEAIAVELIMEELNQSLDEYLTLQYVEIINFLETLLADNLNGDQQLAASTLLVLFESFSEDEITYTTSGNTNTPYYNAVQEFEAEYGYVPTPSISDESYEDFLDSFGDLLSGIATPEHAEVVGNQLQNVTASVAEVNSLITQCVTETTAASQDSTNVWPLVRNPLPQNISISIDVMIAFGLTLDDYSEFTPFLEDDVISPEIEIENSGDNIIFTNINLDSGSNNTLTWENFLRDSTGSLH